MKSEGGFWKGSVTAAEAAVVDVSGRTDSCAAAASAAVATCATAAIGVGGIGDGGVSSASPHATAKSVSRPAPSSAASDSACRGRLTCPGTGSNIRGIDLESVLDGSACAG